MHWTSPIYPCTRIFKESSSHHDSHGLSTTITASESSPSLNFTGKDLLLPFRHKKPFPRLVPKLEIELSCSPEKRGWLSCFPKTSWLEIEIRTRRKSGKGLGSLSDYTDHACLTPHIYSRGREQNSLIQRLWNEGFFLFPDGVSIS